MSDAHWEPGTENRELVQAAVSASGRKVVALDDDPTGVQTVHGVAVLAGWSVKELANELERPEPLFFVLTNSRSLPGNEARALNAEIARNLAAASARTGVSFAIASRSDSTLRGHYPTETDALTEALGGVDGVLICPAFFEGGRVTIDDVHSLRDGERLVPVAETEFARDATFGYTRSNLREWVEEKTSGRQSAADVVSLSLDDIRAGGPERVADVLAGLTEARPVVVNATDYDDLLVVVLGLLRAEAAGKRFLYRTGASFVRARAGIGARPFLRRVELIGAGAPSWIPGLVVVGSHVRRSGEQLTRLLELPRTVGIEVGVPALLASADERERQIEQARSKATEALRERRTPVIFTSRKVELEIGDQLAVSRTVSEALVAIVREVDGDPGFVIGKGGITASDIGTKALGARRAIVLGQIRPGVPVWRLGPESRRPGLPYVVFPGNVGGVETLAEVVAELREDAIATGDCV